MKFPLTPMPSPKPGISGAIAKPSWNILPFPSAGVAVSRLASAPSILPAFPSAATRPESPAPLAAMPSGGSETEEWALPNVPPPLPAGDSPFVIDPFPPKEPPAPAASPAAAAPPEPPDYTDDDLRDAFGPIVEGAVRKAVYAKENGIDTYLEPMLRATIRRALAEYSPAGRPFHSPGAFDRFVWHLQALFTSRTYEEIVFEKTRRFQVEEVYLYDIASLALVSLASSDPARHSSVRRVSGDAQRLATLLRDTSGMFRPSFEIDDRRRVIARQGRHVVLAAVLRGNPGELAQADLEYALRRIEDSFRDQFENTGSALMFELQPFLEDCLLIQAPATAA